MLGYAIFVWQSRLSSLVVLGYLTSIATCTMILTGHTYWSGRPQPIGIDFSAGGAFAVYAHSVNNFTILGAVQPGPDNPYNEYIYTLYSHRGDPDPSIITDDSDHSVSQGWFQKSTRWKSARWISRRYRRLLRIICDEDHSFASAQWRHILCKHRPRKPWPTPNQQKLFSKWHKRQLQALMPKWIRTTHDKTLTRSNLVLSVLNLLEELKRAALQDHNIRITSAIISRPTWVYLDMNFVFEEACFLAGIECLDPSYDRTEIVTKTAPSGSKVLVIEHGRYNLDFRYAIWNDFNKRHFIQNSMGMNFGLHQIIDAIVWITVHGYNPNITQDDYFPTHAENEHPMQQVLTAFCELKYGREWSLEEKLEDRSIGITFGQHNSKNTIVKNMTAQDVAYVEDWFIGEVSNAIQMFLARQLEVNDYLKSQGHWDRDRAPGEDQAAVLSVIANVTPPAEIGSWFHPIDHIIILGDEGYTEHLRTAIKKAIGWKYTEVDRMCIPTATFAARGAALRGREGARYHDNSGER